jgi:hypothetical protein
MIISALLRIIMFLDYLHHKFIRKLKDFNLVLKNVARNSDVFLVTRPTKYQS